MKDTLDISVLKQLDEQIRRRTRSIVLLDACWNATDPATVSDDDERTYRRERARRRKALARLERRRSAYGV